MPTNVEQAGGDSMGNIFAIADASDLHVLMQRLQPVDDLPVVVPGMEDSKLTFERYEALGDYLTLCGSAGRIRAVSKDGIISLLKGGFEALMLDQIGGVVFAPQAACRLSDAVSGPRGEMMALLEQLTTVAQQALGQSGPPMVS